CCFKIKFNQKYLPSQRFTINKRINFEKRLIKIDSYPTDLSFGFIKKFDHFLCISPQSRPFLEQLYNLKFFIFNFALGDPPKKESIE
uniref:hypothetical protein n=1 Tax=Bacillus sp. 522_BSPC TaxID=1579338 RepID=UPI0006605386